MHLLRARVPDKRNDARAGRAADDGVVYQHDPLPFHDLSYRRKLYAHHIRPAVRRDEGPADILVFHEPRIVRYPRFPAVADGGVEAGIRHADNEVRVHLMRPREHPAGVYARGAHRLPVDHGVRTREVDILENAELFIRLAAVLAAGSYAVFAENDDLARLNVADEFRADRGQRAAFGGDDVSAVRGLSEAERAEAVRIPGADKLLRRHYHERIRALEGIHRATDRVFGRRRVQALLRNYIRDRFGIAGGVEYRAGAFQRGTQLRGVGKVAVMRDRHTALAVVDFYRLAVAAVRPAGGPVADVRDRRRPLRE